MGTTTNLQIPYPEPTDAIRDYPATAKTAAELIDAQHADTGWIACPYLSGFNNTNSGTLYARYKDGVLYIRGGANRIAGNFPSGYTTVATLPNDVPSPNVAVRSAGMSEGGQVAGISINTNREILIGVWPNTSMRWAGFAFGIPV